MLFNSYIFIFIFLPISFIGYYTIALKSHEGALTWLALLSIFFYSYWSIYSLPILASSICINYWLGNKLADSVLKNRKSLLVIAVTLNLLALAYFKYADFFIANSNVLRVLMGFDPINQLNIALPIGISFFTFTQIAYLIDSYQDKVKEGNFVKYTLFVTFFPHLIAGPVIHHKQMMPQFSDPQIFTIDGEKISYGIFIFAIGLAKKILMADPLGEYADLLFDGVKNGLVPQFYLSWLGSLSYTFQLYFDFSGYSDMAVGLALLFGIWLPFNFNSPFKATSIIDFWQRWHISLTKYIGVYMYAPITLKFMRYSQDKSQIAEIIYSLVFPTIIIFLVLGIWHGASWTFVVFGGMHGIFIVINHLWRRIFPFDNKGKRPFRAYILIRNYLCWLITFLAVNIAFVMFRSSNISIALKIYEGMVGFNGVTLPNFLASYFGSTMTYGNWLQISSGSHLSLLLLLGISFGLTLLLPSMFTFFGKQNVERNYLRCMNNSVLQIILGVIFCLSILQFYKTSSFLYFQF